MIEAIVETIDSLLASQDLVIVGIDGPTASGKTILADNLGCLLEAQNSDVNVQYFRLDWLLKSRKYRLEDLNRIQAAAAKFKLEGEEHMNLDIFREFLIEFRSNHSKKTQNADLQSPYTLNNLYSREDDGKCTQQVDFYFQQKAVIICEGHYTSRPELAVNIDLNICLLSNKQELLNRKIDRVKQYRSPQKAIDYFWSVDVPSFKYHFSRFSKGIDLLIDNSDFTNPILAKEPVISEWTDHNAISSDFNLLANSRQVLFQDIFNNSSPSSTLVFEDFESILDFSDDLNILLKDCLGYSLQDCESDLVSKIFDLVSIYNNSSPKAKLEIISNSAVYDEYYRVIPHSLAVVYRKNSFRLNLIFYATETSSSIIFSWKGGTFNLLKGQVNTSIEDVLVDDPYQLTQISNLLSSSLANTEKINLIAPTDFMVPEFIKRSDLPINKIYTGLEQKITLFPEILKCF